MFWYTTGGVFRMSYLIAVGSSDGKQVDLHFGSAAEFFIYEIEGEDIRLKEKRQIEKQEEDSSAHSDTTGNCASAGCGKGGCNSGKKNGCGGQEGIVKLVEQVADCRAIVCSKVGFKAQKALEKKAISVFDVTCEVEEALGKIAKYFHTLDSHKAWRNA